MVVSSPTGSGKTVVFELAIIRLLEAGDFGKAVYLAPTKSLCAERARDWSAKFAGIGIKCAFDLVLSLAPCQFSRRAEADDERLYAGMTAGAEMTSDTTWGAQAFQPMHDARILICTPEKWDSITRCASRRRSFDPLRRSVGADLVDRAPLPGKGGSKESKLLESVVRPASCPQALPSHDLG